MTKWILAMVSGLSLAFTASASAQNPEPDGSRLFVKHCARCHTTAGTGLSPKHPLIKNFGARPPADFTDGLFNTMEPSKDWFLVVKHGGGAMGLSPQMPAHAGRMSDNEIRRVVAFVKTFGDTKDYPRGDLNFVRPISGIKAFPETELLLLGRFEDVKDGPASFKSTLYHARRVGRQLSAEAKLSHVATSTETKLDEVEVGLKWAAFPRGSSFLLSLGAEAAFELDRVERPTLLPYAAYALPLGKAFTLQGTAKARLPTSGVSDGSVTLTEVVHWRPSPWPRGVFPGIEASVTVPLSGDAWTVAAIPQVFVAFSKRGHVGLTIGLEVPLTRASYDLRAHSFLLWDMADGPFWEGW